MHPSRGALLAASALLLLAGAACGSGDKGDKVETDDQGKATNVDTLLADLQKQEPYLFQRQPAGADAGAGAGQGTTPQAGVDVNALIRGAGTSRAR